jgi:putative redox protein
MYADMKKLPLERVSVELEHQRVHARNCADCDTREAKLDHVERVVTFEGALDDDQRARLLEIANKCPVHRTLERGIEIATRQSEPGTQA